MTDPGRSIPDPGFAGDDGAANPELAAALAAYGQEPSAYGAVLAALGRARLLVPIVATAGETEVDAAGRTVEKTSDMSTVLMRGADGRLAQLAFSSLDTLRAWDPAARPVPVLADLAARSALYDGAAALLLDLAGPVRVVVDTDDLRALAEGWVHARLGDDRGWIRPAPD